MEGCLSLALESLRNRVWELRSPCQDCCHGCKDGVLGLDGKEIKREDWFLGQMIGRPGLERLLWVGEEGILGLRILNRGRPYSNHTVTVLSVPGLVNKIW